MISTQNARIFIPIWPSVIQPDIVAVTLYANNAVFMSGLYSRHLY